MALDVTPPRMKSAMRCSAEYPYIKINKEWYDLYRAVDSTGATLVWVPKTCRNYKLALQEHAPENLR